MTPPDPNHTFATRFRLPKVMWDAYGRVLGGRDRSADLLDHVRATIKERGGEGDLADLEAGEQELAERRSRKGGRPKKTPAPATEED